jgi:hypothetical protein
VIERRRVTFVLVHSPLVGPLTWSLVASELRRRGSDALTPEVRAHADTAKPFWERHARSAAAAMASLPSDRAIVLVGHSGAGALLPAIRAISDRPVAAYLFVDAGIPRDREPRLTGGAVAQMRGIYDRGGAFPDWTEDALVDIVPDAELRRALVADLRPQPWRFWEEPIPVSADWPDAPCAYLRFGANPTYDDAAAEAQRRRWPLAALEGDHFHMLVDPHAVAEALVGLSRRMGVTV